MTKQNDTKNDTAGVHQPNVEKRTRKRKRNENDSTNSTGTRQCSSDPRFDKNLCVKIKPLSPDTLKRFGVKVNVHLFQMIFFFMYNFN